MPDKKFEEQGGSAETSKLWVREFNKFLSDYFRWIVIAIVVIIFVFGYFILLKPKYDQTISYIGILNQRDQVDFDAKNNELNRIKTLINDYKSIDKNYIDKMSIVAPVIKNKEELFSEINYLVSRNQLFLQSISLSEFGGYADNNLVAMNAAGQNVSGNIRSITVSISVLGTDYQGLKDFLAVVENNLHLMDVPTLTFDQSGNSTVMTINTYYVNE
jgi:hypothetical protein